MKDAQGTILYVGKAISLYNRVRSYFQESTDLSPKNRSMVAKVDDIVAARFPISRVEGVAALESVRAMEISKRTPALLDSSRIRSKAKNVQEGDGGLPQAYKGDGVIVGPGQSAVTRIPFGFSSRRSPTLNEIT